MRNFISHKISDITIVLGIGIFLMSAIVIIWARLFEATLTMYEGPRFSIYIQPKPNVSWTTYRDPDLEFSIKYPETFEVIPLAISDRQSSLLQKALEFIPTGAKDPKGSIRLFSYYRGNSVDLPAWLQIHTTQSTLEETATFGGTYALYRISTPSASVISNRSVYTLTGDFEDRENQSESTVFLGSQNVYIISHDLGSSPFIYQQMLSSFAYEAM